MRAIRGSCWPCGLPRWCSCVLASYVKAEWHEFDLDSKEPTWRIPAERMKMKDAHVVPLARQSVAILKELSDLKRGEYVFPGARSKERPISNNTVNAALRRLGYTRDEATGHGFRTTASTLLNEQGFDPDAIELQLAHKPRNKVRATYNKALKLAERRVMMQAWADYLDGLKAGADVIGFRAKACGMTSILLTAEEICAVLGVSRATFYRWKDSDNPPPTVLAGRKGRGGVALYDPEEVKAWKRQREADGPLRALMDELPDLLAEAIGEAHTAAVQHVPMIPWDEFLDAVPRPFWIHPAGLKPEGKRLLAAAMAATWHRCLQSDRRARAQLILAIPEAER
jgi:predicted DNA-binding transcriptional regulator AlpA